MAENRPLQGPLGGADTPQAQGSASASKAQRLAESRARLKEVFRDWDGKLTEVLARVEAIERALFEQPAPAINPSATAQNSTELLAIVQDLFDAHGRSLVREFTETFSSAFAAHQAELQSLRAELANVLRQQSGTTDEPRTPTGQAELRSWQSAILGRSLLMDDEQAVWHMDSLCERILAGDAAAAGLAGQLLIFRNAPHERRPQLLKDVGEAFYRCFPKTEDIDGDFEQKVADSLARSCEQSGAQYVIELVRPGQRFDSNRHLSEERGGIEITRVHGWVVLRNREKVYTKASVSAR